VGCFVDKIYPIELSRGCNGNWRVCGVGVAEQAIKRSTGLRERYNWFPIPDNLGCAVEVDHVVKNDRNEPQEVLVDMKVDEVAGAEDYVAGRFAPLVRRRNLPRKGLFRVANGWARARHDGESLRE
jgi:hypothetical protein